MELYLKALKYEKYFKGLHWFEKYSHQRNRDRHSVWMKLKWSIVSSELIFCFDRQQPCLTGKTYKPDLRSPSLASCWHPHNLISFGCNCQFLRPSWHRKTLWKETSIMVWMIFMSIYREIILDVIYHLSFYEAISPYFPDKLTCIHN